VFVKYVYICKRHTKKADQQIEDSYVLVKFKIKQNLNSIDKKKCYLICWFDVNVWFSEF